MPGVRLLTESEGALLRGEAPERLLRRELEALALAEGGIPAGAVNRLEVLPGGLVGRNDRDVVGHADAELELSAASDRPAQRRTRSASQRDPAARLPVALAEVHRQLVVEDEAERPPAVGVALRFDELDRLGDSLVRRDAGISEVIERAQGAVVPPGGKREMQPLAIADLAIRQAAQEPALEQVLLSALAGGGDVGVPAGGALVLEQSLEDVDRRVERPARRAAALGLLFAVPATIGHLLGQEAVDDDPHVLAEVGADRDGLPVDARLDLAVEVGQVVVLPLHVGADQVERSPYRCLGRVDPEGAQQLEAGRRRRPLGRVRPAGPGAIGALGGEHGGSPALAGDLGPLGRDFLRRAHRSGRA